MNGQPAYYQETGQEIYDLLLAEFGEDAAGTTVSFALFKAKHGVHDDMQVYAYVFRLLGQDTNAPPSAATNGIDRPHSISSRPSSSASHVKSETLDSSPPPKMDSEPEKMVRNLLSGNQVLVSKMPWKSQG